MSPFKKKTSKSVIVVLLFLITSSYGFLSNMQRDTKRIDNRRETRLRENRDDSSFRTLNFGQRITEKDTVLDNLFDRRSFRTGPLFRDSRIGERRVRTTEEKRDIETPFTRNHYLNKRDANDNLENVREQQPLSTNFFRNNNQRSSIIHDDSRNADSSSRKRTEGIQRQVRATSRDTRNRREDSIRTNRRDFSRVASNQDDSVRANRINLVREDTSRQQNSVRMDRDLARITSRQDSIREDRNLERRDTLRQEHSVRMNRRDISRVASTQDRRNSVREDTSRQENSAQMDRRDVSRADSRQNERNSIRDDRRISAKRDISRSISGQEDSTQTDRRDSATRDQLRAISRQENSIRSDRINPAIRDQLRSQQENRRDSTRRDSIRTDTRDLATRDQLRIATRQEDRRDSTRRDFFRQEESILTRDSSARGQLQPTSYQDRRDSVVFTSSRREDSKRINRRDSALRNLQLNSPQEDSIRADRRNLEQTTVLNRSLRIRNGRMLSSFDSARSQNRDRAIRIRYRDLQRQERINSFRRNTENINNEQQERLLTRNNERDNRITSRLTRELNKQSIRLANSNILSREDRMDNNERNLLENNRRRQMYLQNRRETYRRFRSVENNLKNVRERSIDTRSTDFSETFSKKPLDSIMNARSIKQSLSSSDNNFDIVRSVDVTKKLREEAVEFTSGLDTWANTIKIILCVYMIGQMFATSSKNKLRFQNVISPMNFIKAKVQ